MSDRVVYYRSAAEACPVADFLDELSDKAAAKCLAYIDGLLDPGPLFKKNLAEAITDYPPLWELKPEWAGKE